MDKNLDTIIRKLRYASDREILNELTKRKETLGSLNLCKDCMVKIKPCCYDCVMKKSAREKGIDVKIAIEIVQKALADEYDACVLISGDSDFVPALQLIEERGKKAFSLFMRCRGYSWELRNNIEFHAIKNKDFTNFLPSD